MPYVIECDRQGILPVQFDNPDAASDWLDENEADTVIEYAEMMLKVYNAGMWSQYPESEIYPYMMQINNAVDEPSQAIDSARQYYFESRMIRYHEFEGISPSR
jgi:hypothetical protein